MVILTGKDLKEAIPDSLSLTIESVQVIDEKYAGMELMCKQGSMSVVVWRKSAGRLLSKNVHKALKKKQEQQIKDPDDTSNPTEKDDTDESDTAKSGMYVGKTRYENGRKQILTGFTDSGSIREKPPFVQRRVRHPETGKLVWPVWENDS